MTDNDISPELLEAGLRTADTALLTAILEHVSENQPEIVRSIIAAAMKCIPTDSDSPGERVVGMIAQKALKHRLDSVLSELSPLSQLGDGAQRKVPKGY